MLWIWITAFDVSLDHLVSHVCGSGCQLQASSQISSLLVLPVHMISYNVVPASLAASDHHVKLIQHSFLHSTTVSIMIKTLLSARTYSTASTSLHYQRQDSNHCFRNWFVLLFTQFTIALLFVRKHLKDMSIIPFLNQSFCSLCRPVDICFSQYSPFPFFSNNRIRRLLHPEPHLVESHHVLNRSLLTWATTCSRLGHACCLLTQFLMSFLRRCIARKPLLVTIHDIRLGNGWLLLNRFLISTKLPLSTLYASNSAMHAVSWPSGSRHFFECSSSKSCCSSQTVPMVHDVNFFGRIFWITCPKDDCNCSHVLNIPTEG